MSEADRNNWTTKVSRLDEESGADDYWLEMSAAGRVELTWRLSKETWELVEQGEEDESGLPRSVARVVRGGS